VGASSSFQENWLSMCPHLEALELIGAGDGKLLGELLLLSFLINFVDTLGDNLTGMLDSRKLSAKEVPFFSRERWVAIDGSIKLACKHP